MGIRILMNIELCIFIIIFIAAINVCIRFIICDSYLRNGSNGLQSFFTWNVSKRFVDAELNLSKNDPYTAKMISGLKKSIIFLLLAVFSFIINMMVIFWYAYKTGQI